jgi:hypothetical protein
MSKYCIYHNSKCVFYKNVPNAKIIIVLLKLKDLLDYIELWATQIWLWNQSNKYVIPKSHVEFIIVYL